MLDFLAWFIRPFQGVVLVAVPVLFVANELYYRALQGWGRRSQLITGVVGVPVHEIAHAVSATLFGMRVDRVALFAPEPGSRQLGFVAFRYDPRSIVHRLGLAVTGMAPLIMAPALCIVVFVHAQVPRMPDTELSAGATMAAVGDWYRALAGFAVGSWQGALSVFVLVAISVHATPSRADFNSAATGLLGVFTLIPLMLWAIHTIWPYPSGPTRTIENVLDAWAHVLTEMALLVVWAALLAYLFRASGQIVLALMRRRHAHRQ